MAHPALHGHSHETHVEGHGGAGHASYNAYYLGFALSVILTVGAFYPVMVPGTLPAGWVVPLITIAAVVQVFVHVLCFLHMSAAKEQRWNVTAFGFAILVVAILIGGTIFIMNGMAAAMVDPMVPAAPTQGHSDNGDMQNGQMNGMKGM
ncbi:MAG: cytochrome o ubiquinol oxidase subunit IV [Gluconacetobacter diazotrophicus]|nr:cytochrome o ubiquinol oxidase subunit IV [Gluconacetobacter diazotrophicus]